MAILEVIKYRFERVGVESYIRRNPGISRNELVMNLNIDFQAIDDILEELTAMGKIELRGFESYFPVVVV
jgi:predicted transcriptional regulator